MNNIGFGIDYLAACCVVTEAHPLPSPSRKEFNAGRAADKRCPLSGTPCSVG
jgi:hypothetical protein